MWETVSEGYISCKNIDILESPKSKAQIFTLGPIVLFILLIIRGHAMCSWWPATWGEHEEDNDKGEEREGNTTIRAHLSTSKFWCQQRNNKQFQANGKLWGTVTGHLEEGEEGIEEAESLPLRLVPGVDKRRENGSAKTRGKSQKYALFNSTCELIHFPYCSLFS